MATETISWNSIVGGVSAPLPTTSVDTGQVIASLVPEPGSVGSVTVDTTASNPDNDPNNPDNSQLSMTGDSTSPTKLTINFADDSSQTGVYGAYDATFGIKDIDAGGHQDQIVIRATDTDGNPLQIQVSSNTNYTVATNPDGSVTITAKPNTNGWNEPGSFAQVKVVGGPIAQMSINFTNTGIGSHNMMMTNIQYETKLLDPPICFVSGTLIETDRGEVAVEDLAVGDRVMTADNGYQEIRWIGVNSLSGRFLDAAPKMRPVRISAGALGGGLPTRDLYVSPQHRVLVRSRIAQKMFGADEVLVAAKQLVILDGIDYVDDGRGVSYVHFLCDRHEVVFANGSASESLFTGPEALKSVSAEAREEIFALFPELMDMEHRAASARPLATGRMGRRLAHRHAQNNKMLLS